MNLDIQFVKIQRMFNESSKKLGCPTFQDVGSITHEGSSIYLNLQLVNLLAWPDLYINWMSLRGNQTVVTYQVIVSALLLHSYCGARTETMQILVSGSLSTTKILLSRLASEYIL